MTREVWQLLVALGLTGIGVGIYLGASGHTPGFAATIVVIVSFVIGGYAFTQLPPGDDS